MGRISPSLKLAEKYSFSILKSSSFMNSHRGVLRESTNDFFCNLRSRAVKCFQSRQLHVYTHTLLHHLAETSDDAPKVTDNMNDEHLLATSESRVRKESGGWIHTEAVSRSCTVAQRGAQCSDFRVETPELHKEESTSVESVSEKHFRSSGTHVQLKSFKDGMLPTLESLEVIGVERADLEKLIERNPNILSYSVSDVQGVMDFLVHLGLQKADVVSLFSRCPEIINPNLKENWAPLLEILNAFHVPEHALVRLVKHHPKPLADLPHRNIQANLEYLYSVGLKKGEVAKILKRTPSVLFMDIDKSLKAKIQFLKDQTLSDAEISRVISLFPGIFSRSIEDSLQPKVQFLLSLGLQREQIGKAISSFPALLGHSIEDKMKPLVALLCMVGIDNKLVARLIVARPSIFAVDVTKTLPEILQLLVEVGDPKTIYLMLSWGLCEGLSALKERLEYIMSLGFTKDELAKMMHTDPRIIQISKHRLQKKIEFLTSTMGYSMKDLVENPTFLYSHFERRIQRRFGVLNALWSANILQRRPNLSQITRRSDRKFMKKYVEPYPQCQALFRIRR